MTMANSIEIIKPPTIKSVVKEWQDAWVDSGMPEQVQADLVKRLVERDEAMADALRVAADQYGTFPQIVAKVLMDLGLGDPEPSDEYTTHVNTQFQELLRHLREEHGFPG
jgi:hypothetical protein